MDFFKEIEAEDSIEYQETYYKKYFSPQKISFPDKHSKKQEREALTGWIKEEPQIPEFRDEKNVREKRKEDNLKLNSERYKMRMKAESMFINPIKITDTRDNYSKRYFEKNNRNTRETRSEEFRFTKLRKFRKEKILTPKPIKILFDNLDVQKAKKVEFKNSNKVHSRKNNLLRMKEIYKEKITELRESGANMVKYKRPILSRNNSFKFLEKSEEEKNEKRLRKFENLGSLNSSKTEFSTLQSKRFNFDGLKSTIRKFKFIEKAKERSKKFLHTLTKNNFKTSKSLPKKLKMEDFEKKPKESSKGKKALQQGLNFLKEYSQIIKPKDSKRKSSKEKSENDQKFNSNHSRIVIKTAALRVSKNMMNTKKIKEKSVLNKSKERSFKKLEKVKKKRGMHRRFFNFSVPSKTELDFRRREDFRNIDVKKYELSNVNQKNFNLLFY